MESKYFAFVNCYSVITCAILIALSILILFSNSEIQPRNSGHVQSTISLHEDSLVLIEGENNFDDGLKSERNSLNQNQTHNLSSNKTDDQNKRNASDVLLYRKRRYLLFPEGSSFQIVFDLIIPIVDYTNYAIMGITCAVAWELPSKPPSEIENDLVEKLNDGTFGLSRNDSVNDIEYIDTPQKKKPLSDHLSNIIYIQPSEYTHQSSPVKTAQPQKLFKDRMDYSQHIEYIPRPVYMGNTQKQPIYYTNNYNPPFRLKSINNERIDTRTNSEYLWKSNYAKRPAVKQFNKPPSEAYQSGRRQNVPRQKQHAVYHIMGKRSIQSIASVAENQSKREDHNPWLDRLDKIHLQYHRSSRHALYSKIEVLFNKQGKNGTECILRALCETGQRKDETVPGGLVMEILRTIFTLPEADDEIRTKEHHPKRNAWDEAHWNRKNCSEMYPLCENFIWESKYKF